MRPGRLVCYFMAPTRAMYVVAAGVILRSNDVFCHLENLAFELS